MSTMQERFAETISGILCDPVIAEPSKDVRRMLKGIMPMIKLTFGKDIADSCRTLLGDNPSPYMVYLSFHFSQLSETTILAIANNLNERMDYVINGDHKDRTP